MKTVSRHHFFIPKNTVSFASARFSLPDKHLGSEPAHGGATASDIYAICRCAEGPQLYRPARDDGPYAKRWQCTVVSLTVPGSLYRGDDWLERGVNGTPVTTTFSAILNVQAKKAVAYIYRTAF